MTPDIRRIHACEAEAVAHLWNDLAREVPGGGSLTPDEFGDVRTLLARSATSEDEFTFVAVADGRILGFLNGELRRAFVPPHEAAAIIETCYVRPENRREGVGSALVSGTLDWLRTFDADPIGLHVELDSEPLRAFWAGQGFEPESLHMVKYRENRPS